MSRLRCSSLHLARQSIAFAALTLMARAQEPGARPAEPDYASELPFIPPKSIAEALAAFRVHPDFRIELAAAEPLLASPVALDFDEDGRAYVAEFTEFNQKASRVDHGRGRIRLLEDADDDGRFDRSTVFLDDLDATTAVCCYGGGVFVGAVPNILYAKDTDGDGKADVRRVVFTGFGRAPGDEALFNSFHWLFDNRIHLSTSQSGGEVRHAGRKDARPVSVRGQGFAFDPRTEEFSLTSGGGQHGMSLDDWGRKFVCTSHDPAFLIMYDGRYLARNPYLEAPGAVTRIAPGGYHTKVFRLSPHEPWRVVRTRLRTTGVEEPHPTEGDQPGGYFSAASGVTVFRGDAFPPDYRGNLFVGETSNNLVYRARVEPNGVGLTALRADQGVDFVASSDIWFRPVQFANGPDGALYVLDMHRFLIEAVEFMPSSIAKHLDAGAGFDTGRIYRVVPKNFERRRTPRLSQAATAELVPLLDHPNGWHRDTASRLLYQRQDRSAVPLLRKLAAEAKSPLGRMHSLYALDGLNALDADTVLRGLGDGDARVREHALRLAERFESAAEVRARLEGLTDDPDPRVRYQLAFTLGAVSGEAPNRALAKLARRDGGDSWCRLAILSSANGRAGDLFRLLLADGEFRGAPPGRAFLTALAELIGSAGRAGEVEAMVQAFEGLSESERALARDLTRRLLAKLSRAGREQFSRSERGQALLDDLLREALETAPDDRRPVAERVAAIRLLGLTALAAREDVFRDLLRVRQPQPVQTAAVETLARFEAPAVPALLLEAWPGFGPRLRATAVEALLSRPAWIAAFLDAVEEDRLKSAEVDPARIQSLMTHADAEVRSRAGRLFASTKLPRRQEVVAAYQESLRRTGDRARGKEIFKRVCSTCHQLEGVGAQIGADLKALRDQNVEAILLNILDPNREIKPEFQSYVLVTGARTIITGMITEETPNSLTIRRADGSTETVLRIHLRELQSTGLSFMPEGLESQIDVPAMADLLAYLKTSASPDDTALFEITVSAGRYERTRVPVRVEVPAGLTGNEKPAAVTLTAPGGEAIPGQWTGPGLLAGGGSEIHFILPHLKAGESVRLKVDRSTKPPASPAGFAWRDQPGLRADLVFDERRVLTYHYERLDESTPASRVRTYKVFHHVYSPQGDRIVTNGLSEDPKVHSPHHRGIFYGFNRIGYGNGKSADTWHCTDGAYQEHSGFLASEEGPVLGRHRVGIRWHGKEAAFADEERELTVYNVPGGHLIEFASRLRNTAGPVRIDGDPQHAGFQFRAHNDVDALTSGETIFIRPDGAGKPGETRNWDPQTRQGPVNLPWNAMSFVLGGKRYTVAYLDHPQNPKEARFSEREYGRFGSYFEYTIEDGKPLAVSYRLWLQEGLMQPEEVEALSRNFVEPVRVTVNGR